MTEQFAAYVILSVVCAILGVAASVSVTVMHTFVPLQIVFAIICVPTKLLIF